MAREHERNWSYNHVCGDEVVEVHDSIRRLMKRSMYPQNTRCYTLSSYEVRLEHPMIS